MFEFQVWPSRAAWCKLASRYLHPQGVARLLEGVTAKSVRLTCTSQPTDSSTEKLEIRTSIHVYLSMTMLALPDEGEIRVSVVVMNRQDIPRQMGERK